MMRRASPPVFKPNQLMNTAQIFRESIRILLHHLTHFNSISIFLFSPLPISLFISHLLIHHYPTMPSTTLNPITHFFPDAPPIIIKLISNSIFKTIICFPSSITFSLIGTAATIRSVIHIYNDVRPANVRLSMSGIVWVNLLHTTLWEFLITLLLVAILLVSLVAIHIILGANGMWWSLLGVAPFCVGLAHVMVVSNLARVVGVMEGGHCYGLESLVEAKGLMRGRRQTALLIALLSNVGLRLVEGLWEFRMCRGMNLWEGYILVSMYSSMLVLDSVMNAVFYYTCKPTILL